MRDTLLVPLADLHSGSNYALFPNRFMEFEHGGNHTPNSQQQAIFGQFEKFTAETLDRRKNKRLILVINGDAVEGIHHTSVNVCTQDIGDQVAVHSEIVVDMKKRMGWKAGDLLYYVRGTETHTQNIEHTIAEKLGAVQHDDGGYIADHLSLEINGRTVWFAHKGATSGRGANEGNGLRNWMRDIYFDALKNRTTPPDVVYCGHFHSATYNTYVGNDCGEYKTIHGVVLPSWKAKDRYAYDVASVSINKIGGVSQLITAEGDIRIPKFSLCETRSVTKAVI